MSTPLKKSALSQMEAFLKNKEMYGKKGPASGVKPVEPMPMPKPGPIPIKPKPGQGKVPSMPVPEQGKDPLPLPLPIRPERPMTPDIEPPMPIRELKPPKPERPTEPNIPLPKPTETPKLAPTSSLRKFKEGGYVSNDGKINLGSCRVSTAVKNKKNSNW